MLKTRYHSDGSAHQTHLGGWRKQSVDTRDEAYRLKLPKGLLALPPSYDNRPICSEVEDQGNLGSCTANMFAGLVESNEVRHGATKLAFAAAPAAVTTSNVVTAPDGSITFTTKVVPGAQPAPTPTPTPTPAPTPPKLVQVSRLFEYYATRKLENTVGEDSGATIRDAIKAGAQYGVLSETMWPYDINKFIVDPGPGNWSLAASHKVTSYHSIADGDLNTMKATLASGFLIGFGFQVYSYFMTAAMATKGFLPVPAAGESLEGGHAVCLVGYDDAKKAFMVRNSWGKAWGLQGYFWMSYDYISNTNLASDFWVVNSSPV